MKKEESGARQKRSQAAEIAGAVVRFKGGVAQAPVLRAEGYRAPDSLI